MKTLKHITWMILLALSLGGIGMASAQTDSWTILHYSNMDNDLEPFIFGDMMEIRTAGSSDRVNLVAQIDRIDGYENRFGDWTDTRRFYLTQQPTPTFTFEQQVDLLARWFEENGIDTYQNAYQGLSADDPQAVTDLFFRLSLNVVFDQEPIETLGEQNMGDAQTLADFIAWGISNYPADHYMLIISSHGNGWAGIGPDETDGTILNLQAIQTGIRAGLDAVGVDKLDIIGFDACLMAQYEVAVALASVADYLLAAEEVIPGRGWEYSKPYQALNANPNIDSLSLGKSIIDAYMEHYAGDWQKVDLHMIDLNQIGGVTQALSNFERVAQINMTELLTALGSAWNNTQKFGGTAAQAPTIRGFLDINDFMSRFSFQTTITTAHMSAASEVISSVERAIAYSRADEFLPGANGLSIYFPLNTPFYNAFGVNFGYPVYAPADTASWQAFFTAFHDTITTQLHPENLNVELVEIITNTSNVASIYDPPIVVMNVTGQGIASLSVFSIWELPNGAQIIVSDDQIARQFFFDFEGESYELIEYDEGEFQYTWNVFAPALTDGNQVVSVLLEGRTTRDAIILGVYETANGEALEASLVYDATQERIIALVAQTDQGAPFQVRIQPGDTFTPVWQGFDADGNFIYELSDTALDLTNGLPTLQYLPARDGNYSVGVRIEDLAGNIKLDAQPIVVQNSGLDVAWRGYKNAIWGLNFLYPFTWSEPTIFITQGGNPVIVMDNPVDDFNTIAIALYEATSLEDALADSRSRLDGEPGLVVYDQVVLTDFPYSPTAFEFEYDLGSTRVSGIRLFYNIPENNAVYVLNMTVRTGDYENGLNIVARLAQSISFFTPRE